ncbi:hypothetical protein CPB84DRAFT_1848621 [Gymnopilus junonius]|uniref:Uncharacterized protein n=1 Tax=Gymnopilus junonius TaxID=109634 RepID=A0A9P5NMJ7_GYMJU|nr:hypothetical protein CPB84DRAFT_1848621 [Gymnopilus junonius]
MSLSSSKKIKITYDLKPPNGVEAGDKPTTRSFEFEVSTPTVNSNEKEAVDVKAYCAALRKTLEVARNDVGDELTAWRDLVGKAELIKEPKKGSGGEEDEDEIDDEEEPWIWAMMLE